MANQPHAKTQTFSLHDERDRTIRDILTAVYQALQENGRIYFIGRPNLYHQPQKRTGADLPD